MLEAGAVLLVLWAVLFAPLGRWTTTFGTARAAIRAMPARLEQTL